MGVDPASLYPSVRCGLEGALLTALAQAQGLPLSHVLLPSTVDQMQPHILGSPQHDKPVLVNALLDCHNSIEGCVAEACQLVLQGYSALKLKASSHHFARSGTAGLPHPLLRHDTALLSRLRS